MNRKESTKRQDWKNITILKYQKDDIGSTSFQIKEQEQKDVIEMTITMNQKESTKDWDGKI